MLSYSALTKPLLAAALLCSAYGKLSVFEPAELKEQFAYSNGELKTVQANFGRIPYG
jgi:hypothetical protein